MKMEKVKMNDINGVKIKLSSMVRFWDVINLQWKTERVGWKYDSILKRRIWVYKPSQLSVRYSLMTHNGNMNLTEESAVVPNPDKKWWRLLTPATIEVVERRPKVVR